MLILSLCLADGGLISVMMDRRAVQLSEIAALVQTDFTGKDILLQGLGLCNRMSEYRAVLSYVSSADFLKIAESNPSVQALVITPELYQKTLEGRFGFILTSYPEELFYKIHEVLFRETDFYKMPSKSSRIGHGCHIHPSVVIEEPVTIGQYVTIGPNTVIRRNTEIGDYTEIGSNCVIGSEGFQILRDRNHVPYRVPHVGTTVIGKYVHIGDQVTVANALFEGAVVIGDHTMIDNFCYIAHNCMIGRNCILTAGVRLMGSVYVEDQVYIAPQVVALNKVTIRKGAFVGTCSLVNKDVPADSIVMGIPAELKEDFVGMRNCMKSLRK